MDIDFTSWIGIILDRIVIAMFFAVIAFLVHTSSTHNFPSYPLCLLK